MIGNERQVWYDKLLERISRLVPSFGGAGGKEEGRHGKADACLLYTSTVEMREVILRLAKEKGVTFLVASHLAAEIEKMCDKVLVLYEGEMLSFDTKEEALRLNPSLEDYFLAKVRDKKGSVVL